MFLFHQYCCSFQQKVYFTLPSVSLGHIMNLFFGILYYAECFLGPFLWQKLMLKITFCSKMKFCLVKMSILFIKENIQKYKGKLGTNLFWPLLLIEQSYQFNSLTGDLHFSIPLNRHPTWPYPWPYMVRP